MRWRLLLEEYWPEIKYIKGPKNEIVDVLSRLPKQYDIVDDIYVVLPLLPLDDYVFPVQLKEIQAKKAKNRDFIQNIKTNPNYSQRNKIESVKKVTYKNRIYIPEDLMNWHQPSIGNI